MRCEEKIELILKHLGNNGWKFSEEDRENLYNSKGKIKSHLDGYYTIGKKIILKNKDYIYIDNDESLDYDYDGNCWVANINLNANGSGYLVIPIIYHTITVQSRNKINFACRDYCVDLSCINTEEIADVIAQCDEKINQVKLMVKEYEAKIKEQKVKKDFE